VFFYVLFIHSSTLEYQYSQIAACLKVRAKNLCSLHTGCSAGSIGDALAQSFHLRGLRVFATARNLSKIQHLKEMGMELVELDVTYAGSRKSAVERVEASTGGTLDILVNNAGGGEH
jgi:NADP-dependent 3-hydroxy acid dehydrogenase YdfG